MTAMSEQLRRLEASRARAGYFPAPAGDEAASGALADQLKKRGIDPLDVVTFQTAKKARAARVKQIPYIRNITTQNIPHQLVPQNPNRVSLTLFNVNIPTRHLYFSYGYPLQLQNLAAGAFNGLPEWGIPFGMLFKGITDANGVVSTDAIYVTVNGNASIVGWVGAYEGQVVPEFNEPVFKRPHI